MPMFISDPHAAASLRPEHRQCEAEIIPGENRNYLPKTFRNLQTVTGLQWWRWRSCTPAWSAVCRPLVSIRMAHGCGGCPRGLTSWNRTTLLKWCWTIVLLACPGRSGRAWPQCTLISQDLGAGAAETISTCYCEAVVLEVSLVQCLHNPTHGSCVWSGLGLSLLT